MNIKDKIIQEYPLTKKIACSLECFEIAKRKYLFFWDKIITKENITEILKCLEKTSNSSMFTAFKTLIVVGKTKEKFNKNELVYFNSVNTYVVFYLINDEASKIYMDDSLVFPLGYN